MTTLCLAVALLLHFFYTWHFYLICSGVTSNEYAKRNSLRGHFKSNIKFLRRWIAKFNTDGTVKDGNDKNFPTKKECEEISPALEGNEPLSTISQLY